MEAPFGRYELIRLLDHGGMGEAWLARARGPERVHKTVVLKRIRAERANDEAARAIEQSIAAGPVGAKLPLGLIGSRSSQVHFVGWVGVSRPQHGVASRCDCAVG